MPTPIDVRAYLVLETTLLKRLRKAWQPIVASYHGKIVRAVDAKDYAAAYEAARHLDLTSIGRDNREFIKYLLLSCANFGAKVVSGNRDTVVGAGNHEDVLNKVVNGFIYAIDYTMTLDVVNKALQLIAAAEAAAKKPLAPETTVQKLEPDQYVQDFTSFARDGDALLQLIASQHTSRLSTWGFAAEAEVLGVTKYKVTAVLDGRTSKFCRMINGHIFEVADARRTVNEVLSLDNPDDIKNVQPWPNQSKASIEDFKNMSAEELVALNLHIPPYHPNCRTLLTLVSKSPRLEKPQAIADQVSPQAETMTQYTATEETFKEMGVTVTEAQLKHWNDYMGINPVEVFSKLSGEDQAAILSGALAGNYRSIVIDEKGNFKLQVVQELGDGTASTSIIYDPYNAAIYQNYLTYAYTTQSDAAAHLKELYLGLFDIAQSVNADTVGVAASGAGSAILYATAGFLPSPVDWFKLKTGILTELEQGGTLENVASQLAPEEYQTLLDILNSKDEHGFAALASLPYTVDGTPVAQLLLADTTVSLTLDITDPSAVQQAKDVFQ